MPNVVTNLFLLLALLALGVSLTCSVRYIRRREETRTGVAFVANLTGLGLLLADFIYTSVQRGALALSALGDSILFFAIALLVVSNIAVLVARSHVVSLFVTPLAMLLAVMGLFFERWFPTGEAQRAVINGFVVLHVILFTLSFALFGVAAAFGAMFLALEGSLKSKSFSPVFFKLPGLARLDVFAGRSALGGLALLTLGIALSVSSLVQSRGHVVTGGDSTILAIYVLWIYYAIYAVCRTAFGWIGRRSSLMTIFGLVLVLIFFLIPGLFPGGRLHAPATTSLSKVATAPHGGGER